MSLGQVLGGSAPDQDLLKRIQADKRSEPSQKKDWVKITSLVVLVIAALVTLFSFACLKGVFPVALMGGSTQIKYILLGSISLAAASGGLFYVKWQKSS